MMLGSWWPSATRNNPRWGSSGSGVVIQARDTGRILLALRSYAVNEGGTWGIPGGAIDHGAAIESAKREVREELGITLRCRMTLLHRYEEPGFWYETFLCRINSEDSIEPELNWESDDWNWFDVNSLPKKMHPEVLKMLRRAQVLAVLKTI